MSRYMLDTDICAFALRGPSERLRKKLLGTEIDDQVISVVTLAELLLGVRLSSKVAQGHADRCERSAHCSARP